MPKTKSDYSKTVIYKIVCNDLNVKDIYVGSTTDFTRRKYNHKHNCYSINGKAYNYKLYQFIRNNGNWENFDMIEIEKYPCKDKREAELRERYYYELLNANLNIRNPSRTKTEYLEINKEKIKDYKIKYYENNKDTIKERVEQYSNNNKDKIKEYKIEYYQKNKDKIKDKASKIFDCVCGGKYGCKNKARHLKSNKHQDYLASVNL